MYVFPTSLHLLPPVCGYVTASPNQEGHDTKQWEWKNDSGEAGATGPHTVKVCDFIPPSRKSCIPTPPGREGRRTQTGGGRAPAAGVYRTHLPSLGGNRMRCSVLFVFITPKYFFKEVLFFNRFIN